MNSSLICLPVGICLLVGITGVVAPRRCWGLRRNGQLRMDARGFALRSSIIMPAAALIIVSMTGSALGQSVAAVESSGESDLSIHQIRVPGVTSSGLGLAWTINPPMVEIQGLTEIVVYPSGTVTRDVIPANLQDKYIISQAGGQMVIGGKNDLQRADALVPGVLATAVGRWNTSATAVPGTANTLLQINMRTAARVDAFDPPPEFRATAAALVLDPFHFPALAPGESLDLTSTLPAGQFVQAVGLGVAERELRVGTDLVGFEDLYSMTIQVNASGGAPILSASFSSHPLMGLDDNAVASSVADAFVFDPADETFGLASDFSLFNGSLPLPTGQAFELHIDDTVSTQIVPEPATFWLLIAGLGVARRVRPRRRAMRTE